MQLINLHTHRIKNDGEIQILNLFAQDLSHTKPDFLFSAGLHPWHIEKVNPEECFEAIERASDLENMLAVGECGLDRSISTDFSLQEHCFKKQIQIAVNKNKPLIIHCVRAYSDLQKLKKKIQSDLPWIIHGYQGNMETTKSLIRQGFYFSVGESLLKNESKQTVLQSIPIELLFLETDDKDVSIREIYRLAMLRINMDEQMLTEVIFNNFRNLFGEV